MAHRLTITRPRARRNCQFEREPTPSPKMLKYGETVDAFEPGAAPELARKPKAHRGVLRRFQAPFSRRLTTDTFEGKTAPQTPPYGLVGLFQDRPMHPRHDALETRDASARYPARPGQTPPERTQPPPTQHPEPAPEREKAPAAARAAQRGPESRESRKVGSRFAKVESRKSESRSGKSETARKVAKVARFLKVGSRNKRRNASQSRCERF